MPIERHDPLFLIYHEFREPNPDVEKFLSNSDIIDALVQAGTDRGDRSYDPDTDVFSFMGMGWRMSDTYYLARKVNTEHPDALRWLQERGYDVSGAPMGWAYEFVFDSGRSLQTAHRYDVRHALKLRFGKSVFMVLDTAVVNLNLMLHYSSFYANLDLLNERLDKKTPG